MKSKTKVAILILSVGISLVLCYKLALQKTFQTKKEYENLKKNQLLFSDIPKQIALLSKKERYYDSILRDMNLTNTSLENNLLKRVNVESEKNDVKIIAFNHPHEFRDDTKQINTFIFTLEGEFRNMLKTIYAIEEQGKFGEIIHVNFVKKRNYKSNTDYLNASIFIQNME